MSLSEYRARKRAVEKLRREADQSAGALDELLRRLKEEFDCASVEEARKELLRLSKEGQKLEAKYGKAWREFEEKWGEQLKE